MGVLVPGDRLQEVDLDEPGALLERRQQGERIAHVLNHVEREGGIESAGDADVEVVNRRVETALP